MSNLLHEIHEQPEVLRRLATAGWPAIREIGRRMGDAGVRQLVIAARGTSDNAATYGKYLLGAWNGLTVGLAAPSLITLYERPPRFEGALVVGISQSGASPDICAVLEAARAQGAPTLAITNVVDSPLACAAEAVIDLAAGPERSVAATKTYTAELVALALLSIALSGDEERLEAVRALPAQVAAALERGDEVARQVERYRYMRECAVVGRGYNYATAFEAALKMKELTYTISTPYSSADFRHGPIAVVDEGFPVLVVAPTGRALADAAALVGELEARGAERLIVSDDAALLERAHTPLGIPAGVPEWLSPVVAIVPGQLFAYHLARARGLDPETPRGLSKVTRTR